LIITPTDKPIAKPLGTRTASTPAVYACVRIAVVGGVDSKYTIRRSHQLAMDDRMTLSRRTVVAAALASLPARAFAQATKVYRVGLVTIGALDTTVLSPAMAKEFVKLGYTEGKNIEFERRAAQGKSDRLPGFVDDLVAKHVDVIVTASYPAAAAAKERAGTTPVVVTFSGDPVATGLAASLAHPGGSITGVSEIAAELSAKRLAILKEAVPSVHAVAVFGMPMISA
jgi:putative ABC transport system substrate-binding protein